MAALVELFLRSVLLCIAMGLLALVAGRRHLVFRHNLLRLTLLLLLVLPATLLLPRFHLALFPAFHSAASAATTSTRDAFAPQTFLPVLWLAGVAVFGLVHIAGILRLRILLRRATPLISPAWMARLQASLQALDWNRPAQLLLVPGIPGPAAMQWRKPLVLLPPAALDWPADRVQVVLLHELAHLVRGDPRRRWLERLACMVYWFNPCVWIINRMLQDTRELVCDAMVIDCGTPPARYAAHLLAIATEAPSLPAPEPALAMAPPRSRLGNRIRDLLAISGESRRKASVSLLAMTVLSVAGIAFVAISVDFAAPDLIDDTETLLRLTADPFPGNR
jgi:beta-lactamase regulating signal transducer with metallopeptidase domain